MGVQMWLAVQVGEVTESTSAELQRFVRERGGLILMVTKRGPLIMLDDEEAPAVEQHPLVEFMGPVQLNGRGYAADRLQQIFMENLSKQIDLAKLAELDPTT
jgi:hypothetical protein